MRTYFKAITLCLFFSPIVLPLSARSQSVTVTADPGPDESMSQPYMALQTACFQAAGKKLEPAQQAEACKRVADEADKFSPSSHFITRRSAYVYYASALIRNKQPTEAVEVGEKAIAIVKLGHDDGSGSSSAYGVTAQAKAFSGDLKGSDKDFEIAESYERKAIAGPAGHDLYPEYSHTLKGMLSFHAQVLTALGDIVGSKAKLDEAAKL
jgi:hypothetical protein